jgi:hypothetical protein
LEACPCNIPDTFKAAIRALVSNTSAALLALLGMLLFSTPGRLSVLK